MILSYQTFPLKQPYLDSGWLKMFVGNCVERITSKLRTVSVEEHEITGKDRQITLIQETVFFADSSFLVYTFCMDYCEKSVCIYISCKDKQFGIENLCKTSQCIFPYLIQEKICAKDRDLEIQNAPHIITRSTRKKAADLFQKKTLYDLPVIYISIGKYNTDTFSPAYLAKSFLGTAHVIYEISDDISRLLRNETDGISPRNGQIAIVYPDGDIEYFDYQSMSFDDQKKKIGKLMLSYMRSISIPEKYTYSGLEKSNIQKENEALVNDNRNIKDENTDLCELFDSEISNAKKTTDKLNAKIVALENEVASLRSQLAEKDKPSLLCYDAGSDYYPGEIRDIIMDVLKESYETNDKDTRRADVISGVLNENGYNGAQKKRKQEVKAILKKYESVGKPMLSALHDMGFTVARCGCHYIMHYYDDKNQLVISKTPSDIRSNAKLAQSIIRKFL